MTRKFVVLGVGNFGSHLAAALVRRGAEVLAIDRSPERIDDVKDEVTHTVVLDTTDERALASQNLAEFDAVVISYGEDFETALLTMGILRQAGVRRIVVRTTSRRHARILNQLGVDEVVLPVTEAAERLAARLVAEGVVDILPLSEDYTMAEVDAPTAVVGRKTGEVDFERDYQVKLVTIRRPEMTPRVLGLGSRTRERILGILSAETTIERGDRLIVFGLRPAIARLSGSEAES
ncbi:MAG TPA: TrkA family potassium uptake protein [Vicinamibacteria bacterium]|nr:TrkA family potassium uptake protein [Vicinamibacteria bacterium]